MRNVEALHLTSTMFFLETTSASAGDAREESSFDSETSLSLTALTVEDAIYKGEGNANIVVALPHERTVIRFRKSLPGEVSPDGGRTRVQREVGYARNVVSCFLGSYVQIPEIVRYDAADIAKLSDAVRPLRPEVRRYKEITDTYATKFPDYTLLDLQMELDQTVFRSRSTFCVEIKPKQGYLREAEQKFPGCPYCLNQYAKLRRKDIASPSNYCPFDLFSGKKSRMKAAMKELLKSPQNNLKIFKDGFVLYNQTSSPNDLENVLDEWFRNAESGGRARHVDEFCNLVCTALMRPIAQEQLKLPTTSLSRNFLVLANQVPTTFCIAPDAIARVERCLRLVGKKCNFDHSELPKNSVLERIWNMQRLSYVNTNYIYSVYSNFTSVLNDDMIYSDLIKLNKTCNVFHALLGNPMNAVQKTEIMKETDFQTFLKSTIVQKHDDDFNRNCNASSECVLSTNTGRVLMNGDPVSQTEISSNLDSHQSFYGNKSLHNQRTSNDDERKANVQITAEHLSALQNYLLFVAARDCSILITFRELHPKYASRMPVENIIKLSDQHYFLSNVRVSDFDPKSVHSIKKHRQRDVDIFDSVISLLKENILFTNR
ncbi:PREDICTED: inositol-pentakisphosphate 2-kinase isoform X1 [Trachymyrmex cornetzi]|uniref:inositol-pentakisphosphate 2-kinase isoform X1 n=1 Tax=Trachymyrmex cornetzi TaxID=471704 RepID=UPI00084F7063|nr:PREDICTED: inositol-pentakisphosphate 2-kinase isoform X1 [Trachymyrmex cornetzi]